jgi:hypothetical protein
MAGGINVRSGYQGFAVAELMSFCCGAREQEGAAAEARFKHKLPGFSSLSPDKHNNFVSRQASPSVI